MQIYFGVDRAVLIFWEIPLKENPLMMAWVFDCRAAYPGVFAVRYSPSYGTHLSSVIAQADRFWIMSGFERGTSRRMADAHCPLVRAGFQLHGGGGVVVDHGITLEDDAFATHHGAVDEQAAAMQQAGRVREVLLEAVHQLAELLIEMEMRRLALAAGMETQAEVLGEFVGIGTHGEQVAGGFHWRKADA